MNDSIIIFDEVEGERGDSLKRDMDLIRRLLFLVEMQEDDSKELKIPQELNEKEVVYHLNLLEQAGYIKNKIFYADNKPMWIYSSLTWEGHEFLEAVKNDTIWEKTKGIVKEKGGSIPFEVLKTLAIKMSESIFLG